VHPVTALLHRVTQRVQARLASEDGFTMIELLNVMLIMGILMSISFSAYTTLHTRAEQKAAVANVAAILPAVNAWHADHGSYLNMTMLALNADYLRGSVDITFFDVGVATATDYCIQYTVPTGDYTAKASSPEGTITVGHLNVC
jgi:prepilin-type N-terminal cleavage/methylation domain-containing protein